MKKQLLTVAILMGTWVASAQVGVGTLNPNKSAQLDVVASDKGILIPRVQLTSITDATTITSGNVESLLVYNVTNTNEISPGYYYWFNNQWQKMLSSSDITSDILTVLNFDATTNVLTYVDEEGNTHNFTLNNTKNSTIILNGTILTITDTDGDVYTVDLAGLDTNTTNTSLVFNDENLLTLTDSDNNQVTVDLSSISNNTTILEVSFDGTTNQITITDSDGNTRIVDISEVLKAKNGLHVSDKHVVLGGDLTEDTTISTGVNNLSIQDLTQTDTSLNNKIMLVEDATGTLRVADISQILNQNIDLGVESFGNNYSVTVNGNTQTATIINSNELSVDDATLISTINGVSSSLDLSTTIQSGQKTTTVVDGINTTVTNTVVDNNTEYQVNVATATNSNLGVVKQATTNPTVFVNADGELSTNSAALNNIIEVSESYTITDADVVVLGAANEDITITLPNPAGIKGRKLTIKKSDPGNNTYVNVVSLGGAVIDGESDLYTSLPYTGWDFMSDGVTWRIVNKF